MVINAEMEKLQKGLDRLREWAVENAMKINPSKSKAIRFTRARIKDPLNYSLLGTLIPEASSCNIFRNNLTQRLKLGGSSKLRGEKGLESTTLHNANTKKGNSNTKRLSYMSLVRPILEFGAACWDPYREGQISALDRVQKKAAKFAHHTNSPNWETLASRRKLSRKCALFKAYFGERAWKAIGGRLQRPHYLSRVDHERKIRSRRQRTDIGIYSFVNRTIQQWNQLPAEVLGILPCKPIIFKKRVRKVIIELN